MRGGGAPRCEGGWVRFARQVQGVELGTGRWTRAPFDALPSQVPVPPGGLDGRWVLVWDGLCPLVAPGAGGISYPKFQTDIAQSVGADLFVVLQEGSAGGGDVPFTS